MRTILLAYGFGMRHSTRNSISSSTAHSYKLGNSVGDAATAKIILGGLLWEVIIATGYFFALVWFAGLHIVASNWILPFIVPPTWTKALGFLEGVFMAGFGVVYTKLIYDIVAIFVPSLAGPKKK